MSRRRFPLWIVLAAAVVAALVVGSGRLASAPETPAQRIASVEAVVRCPSCEDLSVAESTAPTAIAVRSAIKQLVAEGRSNQQIESYLVDRYGASIVLDPPASGWSLLVWMLPLVGGLVAVTALVVVLVRRRRNGTPAGWRSGGDLTAPEIEERRRFLARSLADADAEYLAGDLSDQDYLSLRRRDMARLAALAPGPTGSDRPAEADAVTAGAVAVDERQPEPEAADPASDPAPGGGVPAPPDRPRRLRRRRWFLAVGCLCLGVALVLTVAGVASRRQPGQSLTGTVAQPPTQRVEESLAQAATDEDRGDLGQAAQLYQSVLDRHPGNEVALAQLGWLEYRTGRQGASTSLVEDARNKLLRAVKLDPADFAAHLYLGTLLLEHDGDVSGALAQYRRFLADRPPPALVAQAAPQIREAFDRAGLPVPVSVPGA